MLARHSRPRRTDRLRGEAAFARVFHSGQRLETSRVQVVAVPAAEGSGRIGYVIGRRQLPRAVDRNRLRRLLREAVRGRRTVTRSFDIVVRVREACLRADLPRIAAEAAALLDSLAPAACR